MYLIGFEATGPVNHMVQIIRGYKLDEKKMVYKFSLYVNYDLVNLIYLTFYCLYLKFPYRMKISIFFSKI